MAKTIENVMYGAGWEPCLQCGVTRPAKEMVDVTWVSLPGDVVNHAKKCRDIEVCAKLRVDRGASPL